MLLLSGQRKEFPLPINFCYGIKSQDSAPATELQYQTASPKSQWAGFLVGNGSSLARRKHWESKAPDRQELWSETHSSAENGWKQLPTHYACLNKTLICKIYLFFMSESKYWAFLGPHKLFVVTASSIKVHMETMDFFQDLQALLSCEFLRGLRSLLESNSLLGTYSQVTWSCSRMTVMAFEITSMPCSYIYRNRHIHTERKHWSLSTAASCKRSNVITQSASTYSDMVSER